jgi:hypothetical protein
LYEGLRKQGFKKVMLLDDFLRTFWWQRKTRHYIVFMHSKIA